jgi:hypothetical protein
MDIQESGADQREQPVKPVRRSEADWDILALKLKLLDPDYAVFIRDQLVGWRAVKAFSIHYVTTKLFAELGILGTCIPITALTALRRRLWVHKKEQRERIRKASHP